METLSSLCFLDEKNLDSFQRDQIALKISKGGLGIKRSVDTMNSAYVAAFLSALPHIKKICSASLDFANFSMSGFHQHFQNAIDYIGEVQGVDLAELSCDLLINLAADMR
jgi:hypothetical protein